MRLHLLPHRDLVPAVREPPAAETVGRWGAIGLLTGHGLIHGMGVALLWRLMEPGTLRYADAVPEPGTALGYLAGAGWLVAGVGFLLAAWLLVRHDHRWAPTVAATASVSLVLVGLMAAQAPVGVAVNLVALVAALWAWTDPVHRRHVSR